MSLHYKLTHFAVSSRADLCRLIFVAAGIEFEDNGLDKNDWPSHKPNAPFGSVPFLEVKEGDKVVTVLAQRLAIARYLANKFGLAGKTEIEKALADMYVHQIADCHDEMVRAVVFEKDENRRIILSKKFKEETLPYTLKFLEKRLADVGTGYFVGDSLTWTDLYCFHIMDDLTRGSIFSGSNEKEFLVNFPLVKANIAKVASMPKIAEWRQKKH